MKDSNLDRDKRITDLSRLLVSVPGAIVGIAIFIIGVVIGLLNSTNNVIQSSLSIVLANLGGLIALNIAVSLFTQPIQRNFAAEVLNKVSLSENLREAGIKKIVMQPREIEWEDFFRKSKEASFFFVTNNTWRKQNLPLLEDFVRRPDNKLTVILPNPDNPVLMAELANRLKRDVKRCEEEIRIAQEGYRELAKLSSNTAGGGADIQIRIALVMPVYSLYIFDETAILVFQSYQDYRGDVPHIFSVQGGPLYEFASREFKSLLTTRSTNLDLEPKNAQS